MDSFCHFISLYLYLYLLGFGVGISGGVLRGNEKRRKREERGEKRTLHPTEVLLLLLLLHTNQIKES